MEVWLDWAEAMWNEHPGRVAIVASVVLIVAFGGQLAAFVRNFGVLLRVVLIGVIVWCAVRIYHGPDAAAPPAPSTPSPPLNEASEPPPPAAGSAWIDS